MLFTCFNYAIKYAYMPKRASTVHPLMAQLPDALRARMKAKNHEQKDVKRITGVPQPVISKVLAGQRKRATRPMLELCRYAGLDYHSPSQVARLATLLVVTTEAHPAAAEHVERILERLVALIRTSPNQKLADRIGSADER
jgi:predicted XRE-type DNA-binding protein